MKKSIAVGAFITMIVAVIFFVAGVEFAGKYNEIEEVQTLENAESVKVEQGGQEVADDKKVADRTVKLFYYDGSKDDDQCTEKGLVNVERTIPESENIIEDTLNLLFKGELTAEERSVGIGTEFPLDGFKLVKAYLNEREKKLLLVIDDPKFSSGGGSCRTGILYYQVEATAKQFPGVSNLDIFALSGEPFTP